MNQLLCRYSKLILLSAALTVGFGFAQDRDHHETQQNRRYEDKTHHDSHDWNESEDRAYREYLQEHHKKYHDFARAKTREQQDYWTWRHSHTDNDRH